MNQPLRKLTRRQFGRATLLLAALEVAGCGSTGSGPTPTIPPALFGPTVLPTAVAAPVPGQLLITNGGNFTIFDLASFQTTPLTKFPTGSYASSPSLSVDRKSVAYAFYVVPTDAKDLGGSDLYVMDVSGHNQRLVRLHGDPGTSFEDPCWAVDGQSIFATQRKPVYQENTYVGESVTLLRVPVSGSAPVTVLNDAQNPAASPDGKYLAYLKAAPNNAPPNDLRIGDINAKASTSILANQGFLYVQAPHFSPDSTRITFAAVGGPGGSLPPGMTPLPTAAPKTGLFPGIGVAEAHGIPWDIWTVGADGTGLNRLTHEGEDSPVPTWSPDGRWIAFSGEIGIYLVDAAGHQTLRLTQSLSGGGIAWLK